MSTTTLPKGWTEVALGEVCEIVSGATPKTGVDEYWGGGIPWATPKDLSDLGPKKFIDSTPRSLTALGLQNSSSRLLPPGSVMLSSRAPIGLVAINTVPMATNQGFKSLVPNVARLDNAYLYWWLRTHTAQLQSLGRGATFKEISTGVTARVVLPLPPIDEQRRIASVLDQADELRAKRRAALSLLDTLTESIFLDMFGDRLADVPAPRTPIGSLAAATPRSIRTGPFGSDLLHSEFVEEGIAVLGIDNAVHDRFEWGKPRFITEQKFQQLSRFQVYPGDVIVTIMGTCGKCAIVPDDVPVAINTKHLCCITLDQARCLPTYLWAAFRFDQELRRQLGAVAKGAVMPGLNKRLIEAATVRLPSIGRQREFDDALTALGCEAASSSAAARNSDDLFSSLQQRAFRGEL